MVRLTQPICPICGILLTPKTFDEHLRQERERIAVVDGGQSVAAIGSRSAHGGAGAGVSAAIERGRHGSKREAAVNARINVLAKSRVAVLADQQGPRHGGDEFSARKSVDDTLRRVRQRRVDRREEQREAKWYRDTLSLLDAGGSAAGGTGGEEYEEEAVDVGAAGAGDVVCIVCGLQLYGDYIAINRHVEECLEREAASDPALGDPESRKRSRKKQKRERGGDGADSGDRSGSGGMACWADLPASGMEMGGESDTYETYTIGGEERVRASSFLPRAMQRMRGSGGSGSGAGPAGAGAGAGSNSSIGVGAYDEEVDIDIDDDGTALHGQPQYLESDLIGPDSEIDVDVDVDGADEAAVPAPAIATAPSAMTLDEVGSLRAVVEALKHQIRSLQRQLLPGPSASTGASLSAGTKAASQMRCNVCLEPYANPCVSINCWHTHCEKCWLRTLAAKRLCPQCSVITSPTDLRRVYL